MPRILFKKSLAFSKKPRGNCSIATKASLWISSIEDCTHVSMLQMMKFSGKIAHTCLAGYENKMNILNTEHHGVIK
jgi:hypothetical protein